MPPDRSQRPGCFLTVIPLGLSLLGFALGLLLAV